MRRTLTAFLLTLTAFGGGLLSGTLLVREAAARVGEGYVGLDTLARAMGTIEARHVEPVGTEELVEDALRGMAAGRDAHTAYLDRETWGAMKDRTEGEAPGGVGLSLAPAPDGGVEVARVTPGGPAALAGVEVGDLLLEPAPPGTAEADLVALEASLAGEVGTPLELLLSRDGEELRLTLVRDRVREPATVGERTADGVALVQVVHFQREAAADLARTLEALAAEGPLAGLVLDVRGNGGGLLEEAVAMLDLFVAEGELARVDGRLPEETQAFTATAATPHAELPLVVLVDGGSASASELLAGSLQALGRARLVGSPTYGKGSVQRVYTFEDGSALKLTVARYHLPGGATIADGVGLQPEVEVHRAAAAHSELGALEAELADLEDRLAEGESARLRELLEPLKERLSVEVVPVPRRAELDTRLREDPQLAAAVALLRDGR